MTTNCCKIRTYDCGGNHEIVLPNGKIVLVDPYFVDCHFDNFTRDDVTGADYIILTHGHFDHDYDLGYLAKKLNAKVFCGMMVANELVKFHKIPYDNVFPVFPNSTYSMGDVTFNFWQAKHNESGGRTYGPDVDFCKERFGFEGHMEMDNLGYLESLDWMITTNNSFRIMMCSGRAVFGEAFERCKQYRPNLLLRQAGVRHPDNPGEQVPARELAELLARYGAQLIFPFHFDMMIKRWGYEKTEEYMAEVTKELHAIDPGAEFVFPKALKWYSIDMGVTVE